MIRDDKFFLETSIIEGLDGLTVANLLNLDGTGWNLHVLRELLSPSYVKQICKIPLRGFGQDDRLIWCFTKVEKYLVKFGYHLAVQHNPSLVNYRVPSC